MYQPRQARYQCTGNGRKGKSETLVGPLKIRSLLGQCGLMLSAWQSPFLCAFSLITANQPPEIATWWQQALEES